MGKERFASYPRRPGFATRHAAAQFRCALCGWPAPVSPDGYTLAGCRSRTALATTRGSSEVGMRMKLHQLPPEDLAAICCMLAGL